ncbi:archease [Candidatus Uhrbacteria bacterium]|nr:archease [Candidatus Uhrbacteria bacterium]
MTSAYELVPHATDGKIKATGTTRAGLMIGALRGMFAVAVAQWVEDAPEVERSFDLGGADFETLLAGLLNAALASAAANGEGYEDIRFNLITDKKAEGAFVGKKVSGFSKKLMAAAKHDLMVAKNEAGVWEATITFDS